MLKLQICAVLFNMLPIPPLDGFGAIAPYMPEEFRQRMYASSNITFFGLLVVMWSYPPAGRAFWGVVNAICEFLGVPAVWGYYGYAAFRFWD